MLKTSSESMSDRCRHCVFSAEFVGVQSAAGPVVPPSVPVLPASPVLAVGGTGASDTHHLSECLGQLLQLSLIHSPVG